MGSVKAIEKRERESERERERERRNTCETDMVARLLEQPNDLIVVLVSSILISVSVSFALHNSIPSRFLFFLSFLLSPRLYENFEIP